MLAVIALCSMGFYGAQQGAYRCMHTCTYTGMCTCIGMVFTGGVPSSVVSTLEVVTQLALAVIFLAAFV